MQHSPTSGLWPTSPLDHTQAILTYFILCAPSDFWGVWCHLVNSDLMLFFNHHYKDWLNRRKTSGYMTATIRIISSNKMLIVLSPMQCVDCILLVLLRQYPLQQTEKVVAFTILLERSFKTQLFRNMRKRHRIHHHIDQIGWWFRRGWVKRFPKVSRGAGAKTPLFVTLAFSQC